MTPRETELPDLAAARSWPRRPWLGPHRPLLRQLATPVLEFIHIEAAGGAVLVGAAIIALVWANSPWQALYDNLWSTQIAFELGGLESRQDLRHWVNDGLMVLFFFVVGLELKQELANGEFQELRSAALPVSAAAGGILMPAAVYLVMNVRGGSIEGWGVPVATDIAFALGVVALLGSRLPPSLKAFLLALAIFDDVGAILIIALFYSSDLSAIWLTWAAVLLAVVGLLRWMHVWYVPLYALMGVAVWFATFQSGVHATIAGVALGLITPARPLVTRRQADQLAEELSGEKDELEEALDLSFLVRESVPVAERLQGVLHPWTSYVVIPLFALANAGLRFDRDMVLAAAGSPVTLGVAAALVVGKPLGIFGASWLAVHLGVGALSSGISWRQIIGIGMVAGVGFTMSLFIAGLAFVEGAPEFQQAKTGILVASLVAAAVGLGLLRWANGRRTSH